MAVRNYSRKYFRIKPDNPINAEIAIVQVGQKIVKTGIAHVIVIDISPGGLKFISHLNFPADPSVLLEFQIKVMEQAFRLVGYVTYKNNFIENRYEYGICFFETDESLRNCLRKLFNDMCSKMKGHIVFFKFN
jgi:hypothetical protein